MTHEAERARETRRLRHGAGKRYDVEAIINLLSDARHQELLEILDELHTTDLVALIIELSLPYKMQILNIVSPGEAGDILDDLPAAEKLLILTSASEAVRQLLLAEMASDEIADFLGGLNQATQMSFMQDLNEEDAREMGELLSYKHDSAGGLMITEFVSYPRNMLAAEALERLPQEVDDAELIYYIYIYAETTGALAGVVSLRELLMALPHERLVDLATTNLLKVRINAHQDEAVDLLMRYDLLALPVVDAKMNLRGVITYDSVADIISQGATEEVFALAGVKAGVAEDEWSLNPVQRAKRRLPWLVICAACGLLGGARIIDFYSEALSAVISLAFFIPIVMDTAGNVATQSVAIVVRGLATGEMNSRQILGFTMRESSIGVLLGLANGLIVGVAAMLLWQETLLFGLSVGLAMAISLIFSSMLGAVLPLISHRYNIDPAVTSGPLATTILDITAISIYFTCAILILGL